MRHKTPVRRPVGISVLVLSCAVLAMLLASAAPRKAASTDEILQKNNLGIAYLAQYKPAEAEKQFREAIALDPNYVVGIINVGIAALAQVHYDEAVAAFDRALRLDPDNIYAHFNLSLIYKLQGKATEALSEGLEALRLDPRDPDVRYHVGSLYMTNRDYGKAIEQFDAVLKLDPNFLSAYYSLGRAYMTKGDVETGKYYIEKHRELQAGTSATPAVGLRYGEQGKYSYAMEDTGGSGPTPALAKGSVTFTDVTSSTGITFTQGARGGLGLLRKPADAAAKSPEELLFGTIGPLLGGGIAIADVDADGNEDLLFVDAGGTSPETSLYMNRGSFRFERAPLSGADGKPLVAGAAMSAAFGDLDGDGDPDLVVCGLRSIQVLTNDGKGVFTDATKTAGIAEILSKGLLGGVSLADVDHDGDLDIFAAGFLAPAARPLAFPTGWPGADSLLLINGSGPPGESGATPALKFVESAAGARVAHDGRRATGAVFSDFDNDRDIDFVLASPGDGTTVYSNLRDGTFADLGAGSGLPANAPILGITVGDYDKDGWMDIAATTWDGGLPRIFRNVIGRQPGEGVGSAGSFALDVPALSRVSRQIAEPQFGISFVDFDNDGYLDLLTVNGSDVGPALLVYRNDGEGHFIDAGDLVGADALSARKGRGLVAADLDRDGDLDFVISNAGGRPTLIRNDGGNRNHWLRIQPAGLHSNRPAVGTKIEIKAGRLWQKSEVADGGGYLSQSSLVPHFGIGPRERVDTVRLLWPGGVLQDEVQVAADSLFPVQELDRKGSSCPILYAWNGSSIAFVSDFLGGSAIGYRTGPDSFNTPDTDEYVRITGDQLREKDGMLELRMVNQLEETIYFDRARLLAVDHPADVEIFPDEKLMPAPPHPAFRVFPVSESRLPLAATDDRGRDLLDAVTRIDRVYAEPPSGMSRRDARSFKGYARLHTLTLDLGPLPADGTAVLLMYGWIDYADSTSNLAAAQAGLTLTPPYLEFLDETVDGPDAVRLGGTLRHGRWVRAMPQIGFPAGLPKTMTVDLEGALPAGARVVRIGTSMRIYWDQVRIATRLAGPPSITAVEAASADLRYRGFPALSAPDGRAPELYDYARNQDPVHWKSHIGGFTRYGDVRELLGSVDDRYVITRPGDEIALSFPAAGLPPLPAGWTRDYLLYADGFGKDMDVNSARPSGVDPLPYHAMSAYPPPPGEGYPIEAPGMLDYLDTWNTRQIRSSVTPIGSR